MTLAMEAMHRLLPQHERHPLPPRLITDQVAEKAGVKEQMDEEDRFWVSLASHFGYGTAAGAVYAPLSRAIPLPPALGGMAFGLGVWAGSYLGLLPALNILRPATEHPPRRTALMISAHLVWGAALGVLVDRMQDGDEGDGRSE